MVQTPAQALGDVYKARTEQLQGNRLGLENTQLQQENDVRTRAAADDAAMRTSFAQHPDDLDAAVKDLMRTAPSAGMKAQTLLLNHRKEQAATSSQQSDAVRKRMDITSAVLANADKDESSYQASRDAILKLAGSAGADPIGTMLPEQWDPEKSPALVQGMRQRLTDMAMQQKDHHEAVQEAQWWYEHGQPDAKGNYDAKSIQVAASVAGKFMKVAKNQQEWDQTLKELRMQQGIPAIVLNRFPTVFDPKTSPQLAERMELTEDQIETLGIRDREATAREKAAGNSTSLSRLQETQYNSDRAAHDRGQPRAGTQRITPDGIIDNTRVPFMSREEWLRQHQPQVAVPPMPAGSAPPTVGPPMSAVPPGGNPPQPPPSATPPMANPSAAAEPAMPVGPTPDQIRAFAAANPSGGSAPPPAAAPPPPVGAPPVAPAAPGNVAPPAAGRGTVQILGKTALRYGGKLYNFPTPAARDKWLKDNNYSANQQ